MPYSQCPCSLGRGASQKDYTAFSCTHCKRHCTVAFENTFCDPHTTKAWVGTHKTNKGDIWCPICANQWLDKGMVAQPTNGTKRKWLEFSEFWTKNSPLTAMTHVYTGEGLVDIEAFQAGQRQGILEFVHPSAAAADLGRAHSPSDIGDDPLQQALDAHALEVQSQLQDIINNQRAQATQLVGITNIQLGQAAQLDMITQQLVDVKAALAQLASVTSPVAHLAYDTVATIDAGMTGTVPGTVLPPGA